MPRRKNTTGSWPAGSARPKVRWSPKGPPERNRILDNGDKIITYTKANNVYVPSEYYIYNTTGAQPSDTVLYSPFMDNYDFGPYSQTFGYQVEEICQTAFLIQDGIITGWKWRGNDCVAR